MRNSYHRLLTIGCVVLILGCSHPYNPVETKPRIATDGEHMSPGFNNLMSSPGSPVFIPQPPGNVPRTGTSMTGVVTPENGGRVTLNSEYMSGSTLVRIKMTLKIPRNAVNTPTSITMTLDTENVLTNITLSPSGTVFNIPALLDVDASGLDLTGFADGQVDAWYVQNGVWFYTVQSQKIKVKVEQGKFAANDVAISHFSQYAFGRVTGQ